MLFPRQGSTQAISGGPPIPFGGPLDQYNTLIENPCYEIWLSKIVKIRPQINVFCPEFLFYF
jgi:hypothetical protein